MFQENVKFPEVQSEDLPLHEDHCATASSHGSLGIPSTKRFNMKEVEATPSLDIDSSLAAPPFSSRHDNHSDPDRDFDELPVDAFRDVIIQSIKENSIIICIGETGSGVLLR